MKNIDRDYLVCVEDVVRDGIYAAVEPVPFSTDFEADADKFFEEIHSRSKKLRIEVAFKILGAKDRHEFEEMIHKLYLKGIT